MTNKRFWKGAGMVTGEMVGGMVLFTGVLAGLVMLIRPALRRHKQTDVKVLDLVKAHSSEALTNTMESVTRLADHKFLIPANLFLIAWFLFVRKKSWFSIRVASISLSSLLLMFLFKKIFHRKRPLYPLRNPAKGLSFPSGHAIMSVTFYGLLIYIIDQTVAGKTAKIAMIVSLLGLIKTIGFSRIYLRVHYASDVLAGYIIGSSWLLISLDLLKRIEDYHKEQGQLPAAPQLVKVK